MNTHIYSQQSQQPPPMPHDMHNQLPSLGQPTYSQHPGSHLPTMSLPPPHSYADQYAQHAPPLPPPPTDPTHSPTTPGHEAPKPTPEQEAATRKALEPVIGSEGSRSYRLDVVQQPKRARMCGFGDKDRRPITPPPCVRIVVTDLATGKEVDCNEIEHTMFVLNVDLWSEDALKEVNLVRHTTTTPSISSTTPASYEQVENTPAYSAILPSNPREQGYGSGMFGHPGVNPYGAQSPYSQVPPYMQQNGYGQPNQYGYHGGDYGGMQISSQAPGYGPPRVYGGPGDMMTQRLIQGNQPQGMFTRNLIGSLAASAFRLQDPADKIGIWFVLQDLSVRTEGNFRLRFSFVNVGPPSSSPNGTPNQMSIVNTGKAPVLASCFSDVFTVYSAKKFPGVCESTVLSKTFATQGIKIPIRKEGAGKNGRGDDDDDYE
ncbi:Velvet factor [Niveomyces insectorum RCEF 264]|uniref:Velvet factor n=1 Tax=Niveomyces insectorum RCEF 264 TaxID=1081102 RepID=A0A167U4E0_9HYPO|nr:Velvet factor [Niveomyces insectorum RCEF 264]